MFKYDYVPEESLPQQGARLPTLLADGDAKFKILDIWQTDKMGHPLTTKDGLPKITLVLICTDCTQREGRILHHISSKMQWAIIQLGKAIGKRLYNETGHTDWRSIIGMEGNCILETKSGNGYPSSSAIKSYLPLPEGQKATVQAKPMVHDLDDEIPF
jgi:hypothetical protein